MRCAGGPCLGGHALQMQAKSFQSGTDLLPEAEGSFQYKWLADTGLKVISIKKSPL